MSKIKFPKTKGGRIFAVVAFLLVAALVAYFVYGAVAGDDSAQVTYTTGTVEKMTLTSSVSGEGNIEWLHSADVTASMSGTIRYLKVALGDMVEEDQRLFVISGSRSAKWVTAPISGTVTALNVENDDSVSNSSGAASSGTSTASSPLVTIIALESFQAAITVAESDIASVQVGQKAVITFDALPDLTLSGKVKSVDFTGTNDQGVVSYEVLVIPDTPGANVRGGMTVSVNVITKVVADVLAVPSSAVKSASGGSYVQILENGQPVDVTVEVGMSTDSYVEIISGLTEGQEIIVSTSTVGAATATTIQRDQGGFLDQGGMPGSGGMPGGGGFVPPGQ